MVNTAPSSERVKTATINLALDVVLQAQRHAGIILRTADLHGDVDDVDRIIRVRHALLTDRPMMGGAERNTALKHSA